MPLMTTEEREELYAQVGTDVVAGRAADASLGGREPPEWRRIVGAQRSR